MLAQATSTRAVLTAGGCFAILGTLAVLLVGDVRRLGRQSTAGRMVRA